MFSHPDRAMTDDVQVPRSPVEPLPPTVGCQLYEPDGTLLTTAFIQARYSGIGCKALIMAPNWPGQIVQRCLIGDVREVRIEVDGALSVPARIEQVRFEPGLGRICVLHVPAACRGCVQGPPAELGTDPVVLTPDRCDEACRAPEAASRREPATVC